MGDRTEDAGLDPSTLAGALFHQSGDALLIVDPIGERVLDANDAAVRLTDFTRDELTRFSLRALVRHEQEWQDWPIGPGSTTPLQGHDNFLLRTRQPDRWVPVSVAIDRLRHAEGDALAVCRLRDRRDQLEAQRRLHRAEAELRRLLGCVSDAVYTGRIDPGGRWRLRYVSPRLQGLTGRPPAALQEGPRAREPTVADEDLPAWRALIARAEAGLSGELEYRIRRPGEATVWVREAVVVSPDEGGLLVHGVLTDITHRKRAEQEGAPAAREQARRLEGLARLAGAVAHDFTALLTGLLGNVHLARLDPTLATGCLARIEEAALKAGDHCRLLATVAGKTTSPAGSVDLAVLVRQMAEAAVPPPGLCLRLDVAEGLPRVAGDESALATVLGNLLANAFDALEGKPGEVRLSLFAGAGPPAEGAFLRYPAEGGGRTVCLEVADSGAGLSAEARGRLFEPYFTTRPGRRGLGLATALGIVRALGGSIEAASPRQGGAVFRVRLPEAAPVPAGGGLSEEGTSGRGVVLLIDDEPAVREVTRRLLAALGCEVLSASDGQAGLACLRDHPEVGAVLMDWHLPGLAGERLIEELRRVSPDLPIGVMSGYQEQDLRPRLGELRLAGFLQKPFRLADLAGMLRPYLRLRE